MRTQLRPMPWMWLNPILKSPGFEDVLRKVNADLDAKNIEISDHVLRTQLDKCLVEAKTQIASES